MAIRYATNFGGNVKIRNGIGGGGTTKGGGAIWRSVTHFSAPKAPKNGYFWEMFGKNWVKRHIFRAAGAENFEKFRYFSNKSPNFVKVNDFIA